MPATRPQLTTVCALIATAAALLGVVAGLGAAPAQAAASACRMGPGGAIQHVVEMQFDNVHLRRDNPNVPSDIQQMPALYEFLKDEGTLLSNDHTVLISHTADGILSTTTGLYPANFGGGVANTYPYLSGNSVKTSSLFKYWTDPTSSSDPLYTLLDPQQANTPAPWAAFTRAGCDFAGIGSADMELENDTSDLSNLYGTSSPQYQLGNWSYNTAYDQHNAAGSNLGSTDYEGLAIHCDRADSTGNGICAAGNGGSPDTLPDEPGGYTGYNADFGALAVNPILTGQPDRPLPADFTPSGDTPPPVQGNFLAPAVHDVFAPNADNTGPHAVPEHDLKATVTPPPDSYKAGSTPTSAILDSTGTPGFPGFDGMEANNALGYTAAAQEAGIPITYTYLSDVHDDQYDQNNGNAFAPGEAGYEAQLREYNAAFTAFFHRLAADGINRHNTVFIVTVDEGDHYAGGPPLNPGCDGVHVACQYTAADGSRNVGEVDTNLPGLIKTTTGDATSFGFDFDDAPAIIVPGHAAASQQDDATVRGLEREISGASAYDPITGRQTPITVNMADQAEESILHMVNGDPNRTPTFTLFGNPDFYFQNSCDGASSLPGCPTQSNGYAWNHGDIQPEIATTWQGWVGPGIAHLGQTGRIWTDHVDVRPTLMSLLGLRDDYAWDGRAIEQMLTPARGSGRAGTGLLDRLGAVYKQLDAPFGAFGLATLNADTRALASSSSGDGEFQATDAQLQACDSARGALVPGIQTALTGAETGSRQLTGRQAEGLIGRARQLIGDARRLERSATPPAQTVCG